MRYEEAQRRRDFSLAHGAPLLDSSLIITTKLEKVCYTKSKNTYNTKLIICGDYVQEYTYSSPKIKPKNKEESEFDLKKNNYEVINNFGCKIDEKVKPRAISTELNKIEYKNIIRSKLSCQRLAKCNANEWKTFITLTFADNITDLTYANKKYNHFIYKIRRVFENFKCIGIPEFQKRGAVHYHLLTNIDIGNEKLIYKQKDNKKFLHVKYWNEGFTSVEVVKGDMKKIVGYISKYMTKEIDNRLYTRHRYFFTRNLKRPIENYLDLTNEKHKQFYEKVLENKINIYSNSYQDIYTSETVGFKEFLLE